ncbi:MAG TPA: DUF6544 family protein [Anaeromyxobacter sp.]
MRKVLVAAAWAVASAAMLAVVFLAAVDVSFHRGFVRDAEQVRGRAGVQPDAPVTEEDLRAVPEPVARWVRWSGAVGKKRISALRVLHNGRLRTGGDRPWMPIHGEYLITTRKPSFQWYGKAKVAPAVSVAAVDSYFEGEGHTVVKALSAFPVVDASSSDVGESAFGRCIAELSLAPTFFLDRELVWCERSGPDSASCTVADGRFSADAELFVNRDGSLDRVVVMRRFDRGGGRSTLERFTGKSSEPRSHGGRMFPGRIDGTWNLPEGDLHYVSFEIERIEVE